jgi:hypothetical protein
MKFDRMIDAWDLSGKAPTRRERAETFRETRELIEGAIAEVVDARTLTLAEQIVRAGRKARGEIPLAPPPPGSTAAAIVDAGKRRRGEASDDNEPPAGSLAAKIILAGKKRRGEL